VGCVGRAEARAVYSGYIGGRTTKRSVLVTGNAGCGGVESRHGPERAGGLKRGRNGF